MVHISFSMLICSKWFAWKESFESCLKIYVHVEIVHVYMYELYAHYFRKFSFYSVVCRILSFKMSILMFREKISLFKWMHCLQDIFKTRQMKSETFCMFIKKQNFTYKSWTFKISIQLALSFRFVANFSALILRMS